MGETMNYPENPIDFIKQYSFSDKQRVYTNGSELITVFRVGQMIEHYMSDLTPQQIKDMQFCLREKCREVARLREESKKKESNDWIPVEERLPKVSKKIEEDADCPEYNVTIQGAEKSTTLKYSPADSTWFDDLGYVYPVIAWRPLPDPYRSERSERE